MFIYCLLSFAAGLLAGTLLLALCVSGTMLDLMRERDRALSEASALRAITMRGVQVAKSALNFRAGIEGRPAPYPEVETDDGARPMP